MDYALPHALDVPPVETFYHEVRATTNPLGLRGLGECGNPGLGAAIANAVSDALRKPGIGLTKLPVTPALVWEASRSGPPPLIASDRSATIGSCTGRLYVEGGDR